MKHFFNHKALLTTALSLIIAASCNMKKKEASMTEVSTQKESSQESSLSFFPKSLKDFRFNIENLRDNIDLNMDISQLSLAELRVLRNAFAARQGYCFTSYDLRRIYGSTSWYDSIAENIFFENEDKPVEVKYTTEEQAFVDKIKQREAELMTRNFLSGGAEKVNIGNVINLYQLENISRELQHKLATNGFAIVPGNDIQFFHIYEKNDYCDFPSFVTTDMYMQLFHMYFGYLLRDLEETKLAPELAAFANKMYLASARMASMGDETTKELAEHNETFYAIGLALLTGQKALKIPTRYADDYDAEIAQALKASDSKSLFLGYTNIEFPYSLFRPRGHYTRNEKLKRYFAAMMWFQTAPYCLDDDMQFQRAILNASLLASDEAIAKSYKRLVEPIEFIIGEADNVSIMQIAEVMQRKNISLQTLFNDKAEYETFRAEIKKIADSQNRISPKIEKTCKDKINLMPQRYLPDNEILQELVDVENEPTRRGNPKGLDVLAAFGSSAAEKILLNELQEGKNWDKYEGILNNMKGKMRDVAWNKSMYNKWMESLNASLKPDNRQPYFMQTPQWEKKELNTSLASWAELKHDAILYAEQPMAAECGGGGLPEPVVVGYVEPNLAYWNKAIELIDLTTSLLQKHDLLTEKTKSISNSLRENAEFLKVISEKELNGQAISDNEYQQIEIIGSTFEWLTLDLVKQENEYLDNWNNVKGPDKSVAVVADVYTANGDNNPDRKGVLYEATGYVNTIYVVVEIKGYLYLTRGATFSYHEFLRPLNEQRLTDEEWQEKLKSAPEYGVPEWMKEIIVPGNHPNVNETLFYSSGC